MTAPFYPGDPALHVLGRSEEKPAKRHGRQKPKPIATPLAFEDRLRRDIRLRKLELEPLVKEVPRLMEALEALQAIDKKR